MDDTAAELKERWEYCLFYFPIVGSTWKVKMVDGPDEGGIFKVEMIRVGYVTDTVTCTWDGKQMNMPVIGEMSDEWD